MPAGIESPKSHDHEVMPLATLGSTEGLPSNAVAAVGCAVVPASDRRRLGEGTADGAFEGVVLVAEFLLQVIAIPVDHLVHWAAPDPPSYDPNVQEHSSPVSLPALSIHPFPGRSLTVSLCSWPIRLSAESSAAEPLGYSGTPQE